MGSGRWIDSTLTTSAPMEPRYCVHIGPARNAVKSRTRMPARGSPPSASVGSRPVEERPGTARIASRVEHHLRRRPRARSGECRGRAGWSVPGDIRAEWGPGMREAPPWVRVIELARGHVVDAREVRPVPDGHGRDPVKGSDLYDRVDGVLPCPALDGLQHVGTVAVALDVQRDIGRQVRTLDHVEEGVPLCGGDGGDPHVAVEAGLDARDHHVGGADALSARHAGGHRGVADEGDGQALEGGHVDQIATS